MTEELRGKMACIIAPVAWEAGDMDVKLGMVRNDHHLSQKGCNAMLTVYDLLEPLEHAHFIDSDDNEIEGWR